MLSVTVGFFFVAILAYIWGDPVRGPFAFIVKPKSPEQFSFQAGIQCIYPVKTLAEGIDFSHCINMPGQPIQLWVQKTWGSGLNVRLTLLGPNNQPVLIYENQKIKYINQGLDLNSDDYALEVVGSTKAPFFQLVIAEDYGTIFVNALIINANQRVMVIKDRKIENLTIQEASKPEHKLDRIFKYPSYVSQGKRD